MTDTIAAGPGGAGNNPGIAALSRLTDRLAAVTPPPAAAALAAPMQPRFSPAVTAALGTTAALVAEAARRARRSRSITGTLIRGFVAACAFVPYALVALALRLVVARAFFLDGQTRIDGPLVPVNLHSFDFSFIPPLQVKAVAYTSLLTGYLPLQVPPSLAAYLLSYGEFLLPIMLVLGLGTCIAAFGLLAITMLLQIYVMPQALWTTHVYWAEMLLVLLSRGRARFRSTISVTEIGGEGRGQREEEADAIIGTALAVQLSGLNPTSRPYMRVVAEPGERSSLDDPDEAALPDEGVERYAPPHHHRVVPRRAQRGVRRR